MIRLDILAIAVFAAVIAFGFYLVIVMRPSSPHVHRTHVLVWFLFAFAGSLLVFSLFPTSSADGTVLGISVGGALGGFVLIWLLGWNLTKGATDVDLLRADLKAAQDENQVLRDRLAASTSPESAKDILETKVYRYRLTSRPEAEIRLITGTLSNVHGIDVWVNSENTNMRMSRPEERSVSARIRYMGGKKDGTGRLADDGDIIADALNAFMKDKPAGVTPAFVVVTESGELASTHGVKKIFHVAAVSGSPASGYAQISKIEECVRNALLRLDDPQFKNGGLSSILFPLLGTGQGKGDIMVTVDKLIREAVNSLESRKQTGSARHVYFMCWTDRDLAACRLVLRDVKQVKAVSGNSAQGGGPDA